MRQALRHLDELLRGRRTEPALLAAQSVNLPLPTFLTLAVVLGAAYGFFMGWFGVANRSSADFQYLLAAMVKLPALFLLTLLITLPSLYVFNALVGCRLSFLATLKLLVSAIVVNLSVAASFGTILGFFTLSTTSYPFMVVLNVLLLGIAGVVGLGFLLRVLRKLALWQAAALADAVPAAPPTGLDAARYDPASGAALRAAAPPRIAVETVLGPANAIFRVWVIIYALVGAQMGWLLRPFIGSPDLPFAWFRPRSGNFFQALAAAVESLLKGH